MIFSHHNVSLAAFFDSEKEIRGSPVASLVSVIKIRTKVAYTHACRLAWKLHETLPPQFYDFLVARLGKGVGILACLSLQNARCAIASPERLHVESGLEIMEVQMNLIYCRFLSKHNVTFFPSEVESTPQVFVQCCKVREQV